MVAIAAYSIQSASIVFFPSVDARMEENAVVDYKRAAYDAVSRSGAGRWSSANAAEESTQGGRGGMWLK